MIDPSGFSPAAPSSVAFRTKYAAMTGTSFATTIWLTKFLNTVSMLASQLVPTVPLLDGMLIPCAAIHDSSCGSVRSTTVHRIHLPVRPFTWKLIPPSCRRLTPAAAKVQNAAGVARSSSNCRRSRRNCGTCIARRSATECPGLV